MITRTPAASFNPVGQTPNAPRENKEPQVPGVSSVSSAGVTGVSLPDLKSQRTVLGQVPTPSSRSASNVVGGQDVRASTALDTVRSIISTHGMETPLFTWFHLESGKDMLKKPAQTLKCKLDAAWSRALTESTARYDAQVGVGTYFAEDPFTSYEYGDALLIAFTAKSDQRVSDYFGPGVDDPSAGPPSILEEAIKEPVAAIRYDYGGWYKGKAVAVRHPDFLDMSPERVVVLKRTLPRNLLSLDAEKLRSLVGQPWLQVLPEILDQSSRIEQMHRWLFPGTDHHSNKPDVTILTPDGKLTDDGVVWFLKQLLSHPPEDIKKCFYKHEASLGKCGEWKMPQAASAFERYLSSGKESGIPVTDFARMLEVLDFIPPGSQPASPDEFRRALLTHTGPRLRPPVEALAAVVLDLHSQLGSCGLGQW